MTGWIQSPASILFDERGRPLRSDVFGNQLTTTPYALLDYFSKYGLDQNEIDTEVVTGATITDATGTSSIRGDVTASSGSAFRIVSRTFHRYQAGRGQQVVITLYHDDAGQTGQVRRWGYFTPDATSPEGLFFELSGTALRIVRRSNVTGVADSVVEQASWSVDPLNGTGPSGVTLDVTHGNIYEIDLPWLGVGDVEFRVNGILVHEMKHANLNAGPYMRSGTHPTAVEVINTAASTASGLNLICFSVASQGGGVPPKFSYAAQNTSSVAVSTTEIPILAIRPKTTLNSVPNRIPMTPEFLEIEHDSGRLRWRLLTCANLSVSGGTWVSASSRSAGEYNATGTSFTGGDLITGGFIATAPGSARYDLRPFFNELDWKLRNPLFSSPEQLVIAGVKDSGGTTNARATITWGEVR